MMPVRTGPPTTDRARSPRGQAPRLLVVAALVVALATTVPPAAGQALDCLDCDFELAVVSWNGSAAPETVANGTFSIRNVGDGQDSYTISASADNASWTVEVEPDRFDDVRSASGLLGSGDDRRTFGVAVLVPSGTRAGTIATVTVTVQSENDGSLEKDRPAEVRASQVYGWTFGCTDRVAVEKSEDVTINLTARNTGNGADRATIAAIPREGFVIQEPSPVDAGPGDERTQTIDVGVGLRVEDGEHRLRWDLRSGGAPEVAMDCTTLLNVTGGSPGPSDDAENGESPVGPMPFVATLLALAITARRERTWRRG